MRPRITIFLLLPWLAAACSTFSGTPQRAIDPDADLAAIEMTMSSTAVAECIAGVGPVIAVADGRVARASFSSPEECRNRVVTARKYAIDVRFSQFEQEYFSENRWAGFGATLVALGLTTAGSLSGTGSAQALSAAAAGVTGSRAAYEKDILADRTLLAIDAAMHAQRDIIALNIRNGLAKAAQDYPLGTALSDLDAYYRAGTVLGALSAVTQTAGAQAEAAQSRLRDVLPLTRTSAAEFLQNRLRSGDETSIRTQMRSLGVSDRVTVTRFVFTGTPAQLGAAARALGWTPATGDATTPISPPAQLPAALPSSAPAAVPRRPATTFPQPLHQPVTASPGPQQLHSTQTARQFLRDLRATNGGEDRIREQMRNNNIPGQIKVDQFVSTATREQLEAVATPLGWHN